MDALLVGAWLAACVLMIRNADGLPWWADLTITALGLMGIIFAVILNHVPPKKETDQ